METMSRDHMEELAMQYASRRANPSTRTPDYHGDIADYLEHYDKYMKELLRQCRSDR